MLYVYVLMYDYVNVDSGDFNTDVIGVYQEIEPAQEQMRKEIKDLKEDFKYVDYEQELGDNSYAIWEKENWASYHCQLIIRRTELQ